MATAFILYASKASVSAVGVFIFDRFWPFPPAARHQLSRAPNVDSTGAVDIDKNHLAAPINEDDFVLSV